MFLPFLLICSLSINLLRITIAFFIFDSNGFSIRNRVSGRTLFWGKSSHGLYPFSSRSSNVCKDDPKAFVGKRTSAETWHKWLNGWARLHQFFRGFFRHSPLLDLLYFLCVNSVNTQKAESFLLVVLILFLLFHLNECIVMYGVHLLFFQFVALSTMWCILMTFSSIYGCFPCAVIWCFFCV